MGAWHESRRSAIDCESGPARLVNDDGGWIGGYSELGCPIKLDNVWESLPLTAMWKMTGEGSYAGLTLLLFSGEFPEGPRDWGMITHVGEVWGIPSPPEAG